MIITAEVSELTRKIKLPTDRVLSVNGDYQVDGIAFKLPGTYEGDFDFSTAAARVHWTGVDKVEHTNLITEEDGNGYPLWIMPSELTQGGHGVIEFAVSFVATDATAAITKRWVSDPVSFRNRRTVNGSNEDEEAEEEAIYDRLASAIAAVRAAQASVDEVNEVLAGITNSSPVVVATVADLSGLDVTKHQLAIVRADGYLYYYDGSAWQNGIKYGSYELDTTLTESGKAADAAAVGAEVSAIKEDLRAVDELASYGAEKQYTFTGNVVDASQGSLVSGVPTGIYFNWSRGVYFKNPSAQLSGSFWIVPLDIGGNAITVTNIGSGNTSTMIGISAGSYHQKFIVVDGTHITTMNYSSTENIDTNNIVHGGITQYELSEKPYRWQLTGRNAETLEIGLTQGIYNTSYVAYVEPTESIGSTLQLEERVKSVMQPTTDLALVDSYNLIDLEKLNWEAYDNGGYLASVYGYYIPVIAGKILLGNCKTYYTFYNSSKTRVSTVVANAFSPVTVPEEAAYFKIDIPNEIVPSDGKILVYYSENEDNPTEDRRGYVLNKRYNPALMTAPDIFDYSTPDSLDPPIIKAAQYASMRMVNAARNAFRVGTFNIYVRNGQAHWGALKKELLDHQIDICGFQEVRNTESRRLQNFLKGWQFPYGSASEIEGTFNNIDKAIVSHWEVASTEILSFSDGVKYVKTIINLPQYKRLSYQFTLSVYSAHLSLTASTRLTEATEIISAIANDTSDFKLICVDSNTFASEADEQGHRPTWEALINGGMTPIHYGEYSTVTDMSDTTTGIDQIFVSEHITCLDYDIVNSNNYQVTISGTDYPISDHCMVYADLQFDFDTVYENL